MIEKIKKYLFTPRFHFNRFQFNLIALFFITVGLVFGSYLTLKKIINIFAFNDEFTTWNINVGTSNAFTFDTNLVTVGGSGAQIADNVNKFNNSSFEVGTSSWNVMSVNNTNTPAGWVVAPGNSTFGTSDFLVMKYEAKAWNIDNNNVVSDGGQSNEDGYWLSDDYGGSTRYKAISVADGLPWGAIAQSMDGQLDAIEACQAADIGVSTHLISDNEWMTIARNIEAQDSNWSLGKVGDGYIYAGNNDGGQGSLKASTNDAYRAAYTDGSTENLTTATWTASGSAGMSGNQVRTLNLSNGSVVWDMAGNIGEWTSDVVTEIIYGGSSGSLESGDINATFNEWSSAEAAKPGIGDSYASLNKSYSSAQGIGKVSGFAAGNYSTIGSAFIRGGISMTPTAAGIYSLMMVLPPAFPYAGGAVSFRCTSEAITGLSQSVSAVGRSGTDGNTVAIESSIVDGTIYQSVNVGDTANYDFSVYVYDKTSGNDGGTVNADIASLFYNGLAIGTTYASAGSGWWKLSGTLIGANQSRGYGVVVKSGKTVKVDDFSLTKQTTYSIYTTTAYLNRQVDSWDSFSAIGVTNNDARVNYQICDNDGSVCESSNSWKYWNGSTWATAVNTTNNISSVDVVNQNISTFNATSKKISVKAIMNGVYDMPTLSSFTIGLKTDITAPDNIHTINMKKNVSTGSNLVANSWTNDSGPYFSWDGAQDDAGGSGIKGYCVYLSNGDTTPNLETYISPLLPGNTNLDSVHISSANTECGGGNGFMVGTTSIDFSNIAYRAGVGSSWLTTSSTPYYFYVKAVDEGGNLTDEANVSFNFRFDNTPPTNVKYISCASGNFSNVNDMSFFWPTGSDSAASSDPNSEVLGWQYQVDSNEGEWKGSTTSPELNNLKYIPVGVSTYNLTTDDVGSTDVGNHVIYFRTVDKLGNVSIDSTIRTCSSSYGGAAPTFNQVDRVTVSPGTSITNSFALSWPEANVAEGKSVAHYYYMINNIPPLSLVTLQGNPAIYIDMGTARSIPASALVGVNKGDNNVYVVAVDNVGNYSSSNYISGAFTLNSTNPDNVENLSTSDSSIKSSSQWNVTLTWTAPSYQGAGNLSYLIYRSTDGTNFTQTGSSTGLSYVDGAPTSRLYYYRLVTKDGASALSSGVNASKSITPTGKWNSAPSLDSGPTVGSITTKKAVITWGTSRSADSKVAYGTESGKYGSDEVSNSTQTGSHTVNLTNLKAGTKYYYKARWTDEDGNTGESEEKTFTTASAPTVKDVSAKNVGLSSAIIQFTSKDASKVKIYYGTSTSFGGVKEISTATNETIYTAELSGLLDGTKYYYKINTFDSDNSEYEGTTLDFLTLPRPKISAVKLEQVANTAQSTIRVSWNTNTEVSSIVTYYPENDIGAIRDDVRVVLEKGMHTMIVRGLLPETNYILVVKGRDKLGNEAVSDSQRFTTATDTRPPQIMNLKLITGTIPPVGFVAGEITSQIIINWDTDEPSTSQVEFGQGAGTSYSQKTQEDGNLTTNHTVIISNLTPSQVYHLRAVSKDKAGNQTEGIDNVIIASKATKSALDLVVKNLSEAFSFFNLITK